MHPLIVACKVKISHSCAYRKNVISKAKSALSVDKKHQKQHSVFTEVDKYIQ